MAGGPENFQAPDWLLISSIAARHHFVIVPRFVGGENPDAMGVSALAQEREFPVQECC
jgi:hypothetical protein